MTRYSSFKKILCISLIVVLLSFPATSLAKGYSDVSGSDIYATAIQYLQQKNTLPGTDGEIYFPKNTISRIDFLRMSIDAANIDVANMQGSLPYKDINKGSNYPYVLFAIEKGLIDGTSASTFSPNGTISKVESMKVLAKLFQLPIIPITSNLVFFQDVDSDAWYAGHLSTFIRSHLDPFIQQNLAFPGKSLTRGEAAELIFRIKVLTTTGSRIFTHDLYTKDASGNISIPGETIETFSIAEQNTGSSYFQSLPTVEQKVINSIATVRKGVVSIIAANSTQELQEILEFASSDSSEKKGLTLASRRSAPTTASESVQGTGFFVTKSGLVMTNRHVVEDQSLIYRVVTDDKKVFTIRKTHIDPMHDVALLEVNINSNSSVTPLSLLTGNQMAFTGQDAYIIGNVLGRYPNSVNRGIISGTGRALDVYGAMHGVERLFDMLQTDAGISEGNSGGPLLDTNGTVIGLNTALDDGGENIGFAIPAHYLNIVISAYNKYGYIPRSFLGVRFQKVTGDLVRKLSLPYTHGAYITADSSGNPGVVLDTPADKAGLLEGDVVLSVNGRDLRGDVLLSDLLIYYRFEQTLSFRIYRDGKIITKKVTLENVKE